jgi:transcriptional regulator with XRE-family HTH domain
LKNSSKIFIKNLCRLRRSKFKSQGEFAEKVGLSLRGYQKYEQGESSPTPDILDRFSEALDCQPFELIVETDQESAIKNHEAKVQGHAEMRELIAKDKAKVPTEVQGLLNYVHDLIGELKELQAMNLEREAQAEADKASQGKVLSEQEAELLRLFAPLSPELKSELILSIGVGIESQKYRMDKAMQKLQLMATNEELRRLLTDPAEFQKFVKHRLAQARQQGQTPLKNRDKKAK